MKRRFHIIYYHTKSGVILTSTEVVETSFKMIFVNLVCNEVVSKFELEIGNLIPHGISQKKLIGVDMKEIIKNKKINTVNKRTFEYWQQL